MADEMLTGLLGKPKGLAAPGTTTNSYGGTVPSPVAQPPQTPGFQNNTANPQWWGGEGGGKAATLAGPTSGYGESDPVPPPTPPPDAPPEEAGDAVQTGTPPPEASGPKPMPASGVRMFRGFQAEKVKWQQELSYAQAIGDQNKVRNALYRINQVIQKIARYKLSWQQNGYDVSGI